MLSTSEHKVSQPSFSQNRSSNSTGLDMDKTEVGLSYSAPNTVTYQTSYQSQKSSGTGYQQASSYSSSNYSSTQVSRDSSSIGHCQVWLEWYAIFYIFLFLLLYAAVLYWYRWNYVKKVKVNLCMCVVKQHTVEDVLKSGSIIPHICNFGIRWRWMVGFMHHLLSPKEWGSDSCRIGDWAPQQVWTC